ncbi:peptidase M10A and M12B matrixin and adamalysin [Gemmatirosa kalamazoonensis]|uniref:Peptidase M10A and M12B matrixin and adamalysin n=1 Tax=Gemmatirosa kalamazoonensis TaxID=861299 RepID=W0RF53_9BACT|nr:matrixin family metalloprotease [Gemmatirosa kalamazoonensis]AHG89426.1 peptidase M10A and M12B matrixin and adamalysin [Gemmatirosa kalamazoonensis]
MPFFPLLAALLVQRPQPAVDVDSTPALACGRLAASVAGGSVAASLERALLVHGGAVRWPARTVSVWLQRRPLDVGSTGHDAGEWRAALAAGATAWSDVVSGLRVTVARDSTRADVRVVWAPTLRTAPDDPSAGALGALTAGRTTLVSDDDGRAVAATVVLALATPDGAPYAPRDVRAVTQHEMGHALGLGHHASAGSVMAPLVTAERIGDEDRAVLRALYALPIGTRCTAPAVIAAR